MREDYVRLVQEFCEELGLEEADEILHRGLLQVDDTLIGIEYLDERDEVRLLMDLGEIDAEDKSALHTLLLEANLGNTSFCLPTFSIHPQTQHPIVAYHVPLQALLEEDIDLAFVVEVQLMPMLAEWEATVRDALALSERGAAHMLFPGGMA